MMDLTARFNRANLTEFCEKIIDISDKIGFKVSSRGWGYILEQQGWITKDQFDKVEGIINRCRKEGLLPVDFVAEEDARSFKEVHNPTTDDHGSFVKSWLSAALNCHQYFEPDWWVGEKYYIQMLVEKIDLVTLFQPICAEYHIPIGNSKGWSSILQRADYASRFAEAEERGLQCVLLYCGDHDPDGLRISDTIRKNLEDIQNVNWSDGRSGYDPSDLIIDRFGLDYDFIQKNKFTWIDNLITGSGKNLNDPHHPNYNLPYLTSYRKRIGARKCEANAVVVAPAIGEDLCRMAIQKYLGKDSLSRFQSKRDAIQEEILEVMKEADVLDPIRKAIKRL